MTDPIALIVCLTGCLEDEARRVLQEVDGDIVEAVDRITPRSTFKDRVPSRKRKREDITSDEEYLNGLRDTMKAMDNNIQASIISNQRADELSSVTPSHLEETVQQSNCSQECHLPSIVEEVQIRETESQ